MEIIVILHQMVQLFILIALGYLLYRVGIIDKDFNKKLTRLVLDCTLPLMVLSSVLEQPAERDYAAVLEMIAISAAIYIILPLIAFVIVKLMRFPGSQQGMYMMMMTYGNVGFMGFPVLNAMYGSTAVFYAAILNIVFNISVFSAGIVMVNYGGGRGERSGSFLKSLMSPGTVIAVFSVAVYFSGIIFPDDIVSVCSSVGSMTSPLAMILIGATLATMDIKSVFNDWHIYIFALAKQIALPVIMWLILRVFVGDEMLLGLCTVLMMMPTANICVMMANLYDRDDRLAAKGIFITTLFSMISIPLMLYFIG